MVALISMEFMIWQVQTSPIGMFFWILCEDVMCVLCYVDSHYTGDLDCRRSIRGYVFVFTGDPKCGKSILQDTIALSTTKAEYMAAKEPVWQTANICISLLL